MEFLRRLVPHSNVKQNNPAPVVRTNHPTVPEISVSHTANKRLKESVAKNESSASAKAGWKPPFIINTAPRALPVPNRDLRIQVATETVEACRRGYRLDGGKAIFIDSRPMQQSIEKFGPLTVDMLPPMDFSYRTNCHVTVQDTLSAMLELIAKYSPEDPNYCPVGMNMANLYHAGGGFFQGASAQEEAICRSSDYILGIDPSLNPLSNHTYPLHPFGGIWAEGVTVFRDNQAKGFAFLSDPKKVNLIGVAAYDLREGGGDRRRLGLPMFGPLSIDTLRRNQAYMDGTRKKIISFFVEAARRKQLDVVAGALGCGAFENPPEIIVDLFDEVMKMEGLRGRFRNVRFAILNVGRNDERNIQLFQERFPGRALG